jgi:hypothetical protein
VTVHKSKVGGLRIVVLVNVIFLVILVIGALLFVRTQTPEARATYSAQRAVEQETTTAERATRTAMGETQVALATADLATQVAVQQTEAAMPTRTPIPSSTPIRNTWGASYIKEVVAIEDGPGVDIYFTVCNEAGKLVKANGVLTLQIRSSTSLCYDQPYIVREQDFQDTKVGIGAWEHDTRLWSFGRIPYSKFEAYLSDKLDVEVRLTLDNGDTLVGKTTYYHSS